MESSTRLIILSLAVLSSLTPTCDAQPVFPSNEPEMNFTFYPPDVILLTDGDVVVVMVNATCSVCAGAGHYTLTLDVDDHDVTTLVNHSLPSMSTDNAWSSSGEFTLQGVFLGKTSVRGVLTEQDSGRTYDLPHLYAVHVMRRTSALDTLFIVTLSLLVAVNTIAFSCSIDIPELKQHLRRPFGIIIGFVCQFGFMPVIAYGLGRAFSLQSGVAFGLLCYGASPGGSGSNIWCILLNGDLNLSIIMTFISLLSSLVMTTAWVLGLGRQLMEHGGIVIPFENIVISLVSFSAMCVIGLVLNRFLPRVARVMTRVIKPLSAVIILYILTLGIYTNSYVFRLMNSWKVVLSAMLVSYVGYTLSALAALICRRSWKVTKTIMIETGIQNGALAVLMVRYSLPQPDGDLATVAPTTALITNSLPLIVALAIQCIYRKVKGIPLFDKSKAKDTDPLEGSNSENVKKNGQTNIAFNSDSISHVSSTIHSSLTSTEAAALTGRGSLHFLDEAALGQSRLPSSKSLALVPAILPITNSVPTKRTLHYESTI